jgi:glutamine amidotransferase
MCRVLGYLGSPISLNDLLYSPDSSLIKQSYESKMLDMLNLAGFGLTAWDQNSVNPELPVSYKTTDIPVFDSNLHSLSEKVRTHCLLAHVRGVQLNHEAQIGMQNLHPFAYKGTSMVMAHNGDLAGFREMRYDLLEYIKPAIASQISGSTDSEFMYALFLSQFDDPGQHQDPLDIVDAVSKSMEIIRKVRDRVGINISSSTNLFIADGQNLVAIRFTFDFGCYGPKFHEANLSYLSLWFTFGSEYGYRDGEWKMIGGRESSDSIIVSSEPLTLETSTWLELPEYSALYVSHEGGRRRANTVELSV